MTYSEEQYQDILAVCRSYKNDYDRAFERLKSQQREIDALKSENERFENNMRAALEIEKKQAKIDVLNELKERTYRDSVYYPEVKYEHKYVHMDDIDELIKEIENDN